MLNKENENTHICAHCPNPCICSAGLMSVTEGERRHTPVWLDKSWDSAQRDWSERTLRLLGLLKMTVVSSNTSIKNKMKIKWKERVIWEKTERCYENVGTGLCRSAEEWVKDCVMYQPPLSVFLSLSHYPLIHLYFNTGRLLSGTSQHNR